MLCCEHACTMLEQCRMLKSQRPRTLCERFTMRTSDHSDGPGHCLRPVSSLQALSGACSDWDGHSHVPSCSRGQTEWSLDDVTHKIGAGIGTTAQHTHPSASVKQELRVRRYLSFRPKDLPRIAEEQRKRIGKVVARFLRPPLPAL